MVSEIAPRETVTVYCPVVARHVEHVLVHVDTGETLHWCQHCFEVLDDRALRARFGDSI